MVLARSNRALPIVVALTALVLAVVACGGPTRGSLSDEAEAQLQIPGSKELAAGGHDAENTLDGPLAAIAWRQYGVNASWEEVVAYFDAELRERGWQEGGSSSGIPSTQEWAVQAWHRDDRILRLGHRHNAPTKDSGSFVTFYEVALIGKGVPED
jgi:hypothetical protein